MRYTDRRQPGSGRYVSDVFEVIDSRTGSVVARVDCVEDPELPAFITKVLNERAAGRA